MPRISSSVSRSPPTSAPANMLSRSSWGFLRRSASVSAKKRSISAAVDPLIRLDLSRSVSGGTQNAVLHPQEHRQVRDGQPEQSQEDRGGEGLGQRVVNSQEPSSTNPSMSSLTSRAMSGSIRFIRLGAKIGSEQLAVLGVLGRVHLQGDERHRLPEVDRLHGRGEDLGMLQGELHLVVAP